MKATAEQSDRCQRISAIETRITVLEQHKEVAILEERIKNAEVTRRDQATEYERRLTELNHAHEKQVRDQATYIGREVFDNFAKEMRSDRDEVRTRLDLGQGQSSGRSTSGDLLFKVLPLVISLGAALYAIFASTRGG